MSSLPANIYWFKVKKKILEKRCAICSKLTIKTLERCSGVLLLDWKYFRPLSSVFIVDFVQVNISWAEYYYSI